MLNLRRPTSLLLILSTLGLSGCHTTHAQSAPSPASAAPLSPSNTSDPGPAQQSQTATTSKHPPRDSSLSLYHNPTYGISFRYPRNYSLVEDADAAESTQDTEDASNLGASTLITQHQLEAEQPGAILVASVLIPDDAYPNTTFVHGHLQFAVNPHVTEPTCRSFAAPADSAWYGATGAAIVQSTVFHWRETTTTNDDLTYTNRNYSGFVNGACYEFFLELAATSASGYNHPISQADVMKILRPLEKIVSSFQVRAAPAPLAHPAPLNPPVSPAALVYPAPPPQKELPLVHSFTVAPLRDPSFNGVYRLSWNVSGARENETFFSVNCSSSVAVYRLTGPDSPKAGFPCGIFTPAASTSGFLDLQFDNRSSSDVPVTFTLFVYSLGYGTRSLCIPRAHSPVSN
jgi:hypothetical protein